MLQTGDRDLRNSSFSKLSDRVGLEWSCGVQLAVQAITTGRALCQGHNTRCHAVRLLILVVLTITVAKKSKDGCLAKQYWKCRVPKERPNATRLLQHPFLAGVGLRAAPPPGALTLNTAIPPRVWSPLNHCCFWLLQHI